MDVLILLLGGVWAVGAFPLGYQIGRRAGYKRGFVSGVTVGQQDLGAHHTTASQ